MSFEALEAKVADGTYRRVTSVLLAVGGDRVYERYFEGDAEALRTTRSVTKTVITSTNYGTPGMHEQTDAILTEDLLPTITA